MIAAAYDATDPAQDPNYQLNLLANGIQRALAALKYRQTGQDPKCNGYAYAEVPDWALRQWHDRVVLVGTALAEKSA